MRSSKYCLTISIIRVISPFMCYIYSVYLLSIYILVPIYYILYTHAYTFTREQKYYVRLFTSCVHSNIYHVHIKYFFVDIHSVFIRKDLCGIS